MCPFLWNEDVEFQILKEVATISCQISRIPSPCFVELSKYSSRTDIQPKCYENSRKTKLSRLRDVHFSLIKYAIGPWKQRKPQ